MLVWNWLFNIRCSKVPRGGESRSIDIRDFCEQNHSRRSLDGGAMQWNPPTTRIS
jgi:hypothetical protein